MARRSARRRYKCKGPITVDMKRKAMKRYRETHAPVKGERALWPYGEACKLVFFRKKGCKTAVAVVRCEKAGGAEARRKARSKKAKTRWSRMKRKKEICLSKKGRITNRCPRKGRAARQ